MTRSLLGILVLALLSFSSCKLLGSEDSGGEGNGRAPDDGLVRHSVVVDGTTRTWWVYTPENPPEEPMPLVMMFHGAHGSGKGMSQGIHFNRLAEEHGLVVAYPDAEVGNWAEGCGCNNADRLGIKDMAFVEEMIVAMTRDKAVDDKRIYGVGFSQGGLFASRLACEASDRFRGIVVVAANMSVPLSESCSPRQPVAMRFIQGTADEVLPYGGTDNGALSLLSAPEAVRFWAAKNGVEPYGEVAWRPDEESGWVKINRYRDPEGHPRRFAELLSVYMQGHRWISNPWVDSNEEILEMVQNH